MFSKYLNMQEQITLPKILFQDNLSILSVRGNARQVHFQECSSAVDGCRLIRWCSLFSRHQLWHMITCNPKYIILFSTKSAVKTATGSCVYKRCGCSELKKKSLTNSVFSFFICGNLKMRTNSRGMYEKPHLFNEVKLCLPLPMLCLASVFVTLIQMTQERNRIKALIDRGKKNDTQGKNHQNQIRNIKSNSMTHFVLANSGTLMCAKSVSL